jgi:prevent-host-death family protein
MEGGVGIRTFRDRLTRYVARVRRGDRVVITDRGKPVAILVPYAASGTDSTQAKLAALFASGHVQPAQRPFLKTVAAVKGRGKPASTIISETRR